MTRAHAALLLALLVTSGCSREEARPPGQWPASRDELAAAPARPAQDDPGELTYRRYCIGCHGADGRGNGGLSGADFSAPGGPLATKPDAELLASIRDGKRGKTATMPAHKPVLKEAEIAAVLGYVRAHFGKPATAPSTP